jgi:hypothetical protein
MDQRCKRCPPCQPRWMSTYALLTSIGLVNGGEILNVFGDRAQTGAYMIRKGLDPAFVADLVARVLVAQTTSKRPSRIPRGL